MSSGTNRCSTWRPTTSDDAKPNTLSAPALHHSIRPSGFIQNTARSCACSIASPKRLSAGLCTGGCRGLGTGDWGLGGDTCAFRVVRERPLAGGDCSESAETKNSVISVFGRGVCVVLASLHRPPGSSPQPQAASPSLAHLQQRPAPPRRMNGRAKQCDADPKVKHVEQQRVSKQCDVERVVQEHAAHPLENVSRR